MRGNKLTVPIKALAFAIKGNLPEDVKLERLRLFLQQEADRKNVNLDIDGRILQGQVDGKDEYYFYNGPKGIALALPELPTTLD